MALQKGRQQYLALASEDTRMTAETTGFTFLPWTSITAPGNQNDYLMDESAYGNRGKLLNKVLRKQHATFGCGGHIDADTILLPLYSIFGTAVATTALGATTWAISLNQNIESKTFTVQYQANQEGHKKITGWMASKLDFEFGTDSSTYTLEGIGLAESDGATLTPSVPKPDKYLLGRHVGVSYAATLAGLPGTAITDIKTVTGGFDPGLDIARNEVVGALNPTNISHDGFTSTFEFTRINNDAQASTFQDFQDAGTKQAFRIEAVASNLPVIGTSALKPTLRFDFPPSTVTSVTEIAIDDYLMQTITIEVEQPELIAVTLINEIATA